MEWADENRSRCLLISSKDPARLKRVIAMLEAHGIQSEKRVLHIAPAFGGI